MQLELVHSVIPVLGSVRGGEQKKGMRVRKQESVEALIKRKGKQEGLVCSSCWMWRAGGAVMCDCQNS